MLDLAFAVERTEPNLYAVSPEVTLALAIRAPEGAHVHGALLACQARIEVARRSYDDDEAERLFDLMGPRRDWSRTQQNLLWAQPTVLVPAFRQATTVELHLPCSLGFELGTEKYLEGLGGGVVPLLLLFSGTVFHAGADERLQAAPIARSAECRFPLPHAVYRRAVAHYLGERTPVALERALLARLSRYQRQSGATSLEVALGELLDRAEAGA